MTLLCQLAAKYGTDKGVYTPFYSLLLERKRFDVRRVLEIGIGTPAAMKHVAGYQVGASLRMWEEYFPNAKIYGVDKDPVAIVSIGERVNTIHADQTRLDQNLMASLGPFDLIVDDGSHHVEHQLSTFETLLPFLSEGGLYIIEDVNAADGLSLKMPHPHTDVFVRTNGEGHCMVLNAQH